MSYLYLSLAVDPTTGDLTLENSATDAADAVEAEHRITRARLRAYRINIQTVGDRPVVGSPPCSELVVQTEYQSCRRSQVPVDDD